jgi:hypothetical protein
MAEVGAQMVQVFLVLAITFAGPTAAIVLLVRRRRLAHTARRSPLTEELLRAPGHSLREKLEELRGDLAFDIAALMTIPNMLLAIYLLQLQFRRVPPAMWVNVVLAVGALGLITHSVRSLLRRSAEMDKLRKGLDAEMAVGQQLDQLMRQGAAVFHDLDAEKFNIDHVVIAPQGVFCVETKGYTKPVDKGGGVLASVTFDGRALIFPQGPTTKPIEQAERNARWLAQWLTSATGDSFQVVPVLALPGWYVDRKNKGSVRVFSGKELPSLLKGGASHALSPDKMQRAVHQLEQRCRDVKPRYRPPE